MAIRQNILAHYKQGHSISRISRHFEVCRTTIYTLIRRYEKDGQTGLEPKYANCGKTRPSDQDFIFRAVRCLKTWHPGWGAEKILAEITLKRPKLDLPSERTVYRWFKWNKQTSARSKLPKEPKKWAEQLHEGWQIDAKEEMRTQDSQLHCWLNITDEHSGTVIDPPVFPPQENL